MNYISFAFIGFLLVVLLLYYLVPFKFRWLILLFASLSFFIINCKFFILPMLLFGIIIYFSAIKMSKIDEFFKAKKKSLEKNERKSYKKKIQKNKNIILWFSIICSIVLLFVFKYFSFYKSFFSSVLGFELFGIDIVAPIGISYYTLMGISYLVDVYRKNTKVQTNYFKLILFLSFFPHIIEGPIGRYDKLSSQLYNGNKFEYNNFSQGIFVILFGLVKKLIIADRIAPLVNEVFDNYNDYYGLSIVIAVLLYVVQIYADFSGCIDIVRGVARLFGVELEQNFNQPFFSTSIQEFWRRWHITLGAWLRDYIFYPLSLSKPLINYSKKTKNNFFKTVVPVLVSNFAVWIVMGIWHGAGIKYIIYGLYYFIVVGFGILLKPLINNSNFVNNNSKKSFYKIFQIARTIVLVTIGMFIFRSENLIQFAEMMKSVFVISFNISFVFDVVSKYDLILLAITILIWVYNSFINEYKNNSFIQIIMKKPLLIRWSTAFVLVVFIVLLGKYGPGYNAGDFIYGGF